MLLVETIPFTPQILEKSDDGIMRIRGVFQRAEAKNANGRVYSRKLWERLLSEDSPIRERLSSRGMVGHLEHPPDGVTDLNKGALVITDLSIDEKNQIIGTAELLDTEAGKAAQEYVNKKVRIGISSRGSGTVGSNGQVSEDYKLETFDLVYNPSTTGAYPAQVKDGKTPKSESVTPEEIVVPTNKSEETQEKEEVMNKPVETLQGIESGLRPILEQDINGLLPYQVSEIDGRLLEASVQLGSLVAAKPEMQGAAGNLQERINDKRKTLSEMSAGGKREGEEDVELEIPDLDELEEEDEEEGVDEDGNLIDIDKFESLLDDVEEEAAQGAVLKAAKKEIEKYRETLEAAEALQLSTVERLEQVQAERDAAVGLLNELTASEKAEEVAEAIAQCVEASPALQGVVDMLAESQSPEEVFERVQALQTLGGGEDEEELEEDDDLDLSELEDLDLDLEEEDDEEDDDEDDDEEGLPLPPKKRKVSKKKTSKKKKVSKKKTGMKEGTSKRSNLFEDLDLDEDLASEEDVSRGVLETARDTELANHKGRRLVTEAIKRVGTTGK